MELYVDGDSSGFAPDEFDDIKLCFQFIGKVIVSHGSKLPPFLRNE